MLLWNVNNLEAQCSCWLISVHLWKHTGSKFGCLFRITGFKYNDRNQVTYSKCYIATSHSNWCSESTNSQVFLTRKRKTPLYTTCNDYDVHINLEWMHVDYLGTIWHKHTPSSILNEQDHNQLCTDTSVFPFTLKTQQSFADKLHLQLHLAVISTSYTDTLMLIREDLWLQKLVNIFSRLQCSLYCASAEESLLRAFFHRWEKKGGLR